MQILASTMTTSRRLADRKVERFEKNIKKRGAVPETTTKKGTSYPVGPIVLGFFIFVVIGSSVVTAIFYLNETKHGTLLFNYSWDNPDSHKWRHGLNDEFTLLIVEYGSCRDVILLLKMIMTSFDPLISGLVNFFSDSEESMDALDSVIDPLREFAKDSTRLVKRCHKPDQKEFTKVAFRVAIGFVVMGFVGFFVKLIFIPINNIIVGSA
ncbi:unnamed protein product [Camellia sinensis]